MTFTVFNISSKIPFSKTLYHMETSQLISIANEFTNLMFQISTEGYFWTYYRTITYNNILFETAWFGLELHNHLLPKANE